MNYGIDMLALLKSSRTYELEHSRIMNASRKGVAIKQGSSARALDNPLARTMRGTAGHTHEQQQVSTPASTP